VVLQELRHRERALLSLPPGVAGEDDRGGEEGEAVLGLVVEAGGIGRVVEHVDRVAVDEGISRRGRLTLGQEVPRRALHPVPAAAVAVDNALRGPQVERRETDREPVGKRRVVQGVQIGRGHPAGEMKERDEGEMLGADDRLPAGRRVLGREDLIEMDAGARDPHRLVLPGHTRVEMAEKLLGVQRADPQGAAQPGAEDVQVTLKPLEGVEPGPLLLRNPVLEAQQEVLVDLAGWPEGRGEHGRRLKESAVLEVGLPPAVVHQPAHRIGEVALARVAGSGFADRVEVEGPGGDEGTQGPAELGRQGIELLVGRGVAVGALERKGRRQGAVLVEDDPLRPLGDHEGPRQEVDEAAAAGLEVAEPVDEPPQAEAEAEHHGGKDGHLRSAFPGGRPRPGLIGLGKRGVVVPVAEIRQHQAEQVMVERRQARAGEVGDGPIGHQEPQRTQGKAPVAKDRNPAGGGGEEQLPLDPHEERGTEQRAVDAMLFERQS
jgi:hypothetical protein